MAPASPHRKDRIREAAQRLGFDLCGIAPAALSEEDRQHYLRWVGNGFHGEMKYMERREREDIRRLLPGARSVICAGMVQRAAAIVGGVQRPGARLDRPLRLGR